MQIGDIVYDVEGQAMTLVLEAPGVGYIVRPLFAGEDDEAYEGELEFAEKVFATQPRPRILGNIAELEKRLADVRREIMDANRELTTAKQEREKLLAKVRDQCSALSRIGEFLDGKITHYVVVRYGEITILSLGDAVCESRKHDLKLLTLFGKVNGSLEWGLNAYSDGSGGNTTCYPCESMEAAKAKVAELIDDSVACWRADKSEQQRKNPYYVSHAMEAANKYGIAFPQDIADDIRAIRIADKAKIVEKKRQELEKVEAELKAL